MRILVSWKTAAASLGEDQFQECNFMSISGNEDHKLILNALGLHAPYLSTKKIKIFDDSPFILDNQHSAWLEASIFCADYCQDVGRPTGSQILNLKEAEIQSMTFHVTYLH